jgi:hypothetical protein
MTTTNQNGPPETIKNKHLAVCHSRPMPPDILVCTPSLFSRLLSELLVLAQTKNKKHHTHQLHPLACLHMASHVGCHL